MTAVDHTYHTQHGVRWVHRPTGHESFTLCTSADEANKIIERSREMDLQSDAEAVHREVGPWRSNT